MNKLVRASDAIDRAMTVVMWIGGALMLGMMLAIATEIVTRRLRMEIPGLGPVRLLELQWHFHAALFMLTLGFAYNHNVHVRIDMLVSNAGARVRAWIELVGIVVFLLPFTAALVWWGSQYAYQSYSFNEVSDMAGGLGARWIVKTMIPLGALLLMISGVSNLLRLVAFLAGKSSGPGTARPSMAGEDVTLIETASTERSS